MKYGLHLNNKKSSYFFKKTLSKFVIILSFKIYFFTPSTFNYQTLFSQRFIFEFLTLSKHNSWLYRKKEVSLYQIIKV